MRLIIYINILLIAVASLALDNTKIMMPVETGLSGDSSVIEGLVTEKGTGLPLDGVIVRCKGDSESVITMANGSFRINVQPGTSRLVFIKPGWIKKTVRVRRIRKKTITLRKDNRASAPGQPEEDLPSDTVQPLHYPVHY